MARTARGGAALAFRDGGIRTILTAVFAVGFAISATELLAPSFVEHLIGGSERASALYGALVTTSFVASGLGSGAAVMISRVTGGAMRGAAFACLLAAVGYVALGLSTGLVIMVISYVVIYAALGAADPLRIEQLHRRVGSKQRTTMLSMESLTLMAGGSVGSLTVGRLVERYGYTVGWFSCVTALLIAGSISVAMRDRSATTQPVSAVEGGGCQ